LRTITTDSYPMKFPHRMENGKVAPGSAGADAAPDRNYDWDKLDYLSKKFMQVRGMVREDLASFLSFLTALSDSAE